jgi:flagellar assembly factor FliW
MPNKKQGPLFWIQSVDDPDIAFVLTDPTVFFLDYQILPDTSERQSLHLEENDDFFVLSIVTVPPDQKITLNLAAPLFFAAKTNRAIQVILQDGKYSSKAPLPQ